MQKQSRPTSHIFDLTIKYLLQGTSPANTVHLINGLFKRQYAADSSVHFRRTEDVQKQGKSLEQFRSDMIVSIGDDDFVVEFQIGNDEIMGLRIFEYGLHYAYDTKQIHENGELIELSLPEGCVVFWESTASTPNTIRVRFTSKTNEQVYDYEVPVFKMVEQSVESLEERKLMVLLPFCLLKFRKDLKRAQENPEKRQAVARAERELLEVLEEILVRSREEQAVSNRDCIMILESVAQMHEELYQSYPEFQEASMVLDDRIKLRWKAHEVQLNTQWKAHEQELIQTAKQERDKIFSLLRQGYTADEVEQLFAQEEDKPQ